MARTPAPPGPPPPHYRPPGTPRPSAPLTPGFGTANPVPSPPIGGGLGPGTATAIAVATLLLGVVAGFFLGRSYESGSDGSRAAPLTTPTTSTPTTRPPGDTVPQNAPDASTTAPPGTELAPTTIGTFDDPIPVGQAYILGLYEIEVLDADRDATAALSAFDPSNPAPPDGQQHVLVRLAVRFTDANGLGNPASIPFFVSDGTSEWYAFDASCGRLPDDLGLAGFIEQGDEARGNTCFTVPVDAVDDLVLGTEGFAGPLYFAIPR